MVRRLESFIRVKVPLQRKQCVYARVKERQCVYARVNERQCVYERKKDSERIFGPAKYGNKSMKTQLCVQRLLALLCLTLFCCV